MLPAAGSQQCHPAGPGAVLRFTDRHAEIRVPALHRVPSSLDPLYGLVRRCLDLIQQNPLPTGEPRARGRKFGVRVPGAPRARCRGAPTRLSRGTGGAVRAGLCRLCRRGSALHRGRAGGRDVLLLLPEPAA
uniref:Uncharacterized protein n=1 Tax=Serinus canaria TaxID=9135 RepID=A0A8C9MFS1_SERCA